MERAIESEQKKEQLQKDNKQWVASSTVSKRTPGRSTKSHAKQPLTPSQKLSQFFYKETARPLGEELFFEIKKHHKKSKKVKAAYKKIEERSFLRYLLSSAAQQDNPYLTFQDAVETIANMEKTDVNMLFRCVKQLQASSKTSWNAYTTINFFYQLANTSNNEDLRALINKLFPLPFASKLAIRVINNITYPRVYKPIKNLLKNAIKQSTLGLDEFAKTSTKTSITRSLKNSDLTHSEEEEEEVIDTLARSSLRTTTTSSQNSNPKKSEVDAEKKEEIATEESSTSEKHEPAYVMEARQISVDYYLKVIKSSIGSNLIPDIIKNTWGKLLQISLGEFFKKSKAGGLITNQNNYDYIMAYQLQYIDEAPQNTPTVLKFVQQTNGCVYLSRVTTQEETAVLNSATTAQKMNALTFIDYKHAIFPTATIAQVAEIVTSGGLGGNIDADIESRKDKTSWIQGIAVQLSERKDRSGLGTRVAEKLHETSDKKEKFLALLKEFYMAILIYPALKFLKTLGYPVKSIEFEYEVTKDLAEECAEEFLSNKTAQNVFIEAVLYLGYGTYTKDLDDGIKTKKSKTKKLNIKPHEVESDMLYHLTVALDEKKKERDNIEKELKEFLLNRGDQKTKDFAAAGLKNAKNSFVDFVKVVTATKDVLEKRVLHIISRREQDKTKQKEELTNVFKELNECLKKLMDLDVINELLRKIVAGSGKNLDVLLQQPIVFHFHHNNEKVKADDDTDEPLTVINHAKRLGLLDLVQLTKVDKTEVSKKESSPIKGSKKPGFFDKSPRSTKALKEKPALEKNEERKDTVTRKEKTSVPSLLFLKEASKEKVPVEFGSESHSESEIDEPESNSSSSSLI